MGRPKNPNKSTRIVSVRLNREAADALDFLQNRREGINISRFVRQVTIELAKEHGYAPTTKENTPC